MGNMVGLLRALLGHMVLRADRPVLMERLRTLVLMGLLLLPTTPAPTEVLPPRLITVHPRLRRARTHLHPLETTPRPSPQLSSMGHRRIHMDLKAGTHRLDNQVDMRLQVNKADTRHQVSQADTRILSPVSVGQWLPSRLLQDLSTSSPPMHPLHCSPLQSAAISPAGMTRPMSRSRNVVRLFLPHQQQPLSPLLSPIPPRPDLPQRRMVKSRSCLRHRGGLERLNA